MHSNQDVENKLDCSSENSWLSAYACEGRGTSAEKSAAGLAGPSTDSMRRAMVASELCDRPGNSPKGNPIHTRPLRALSKRVSHRLSFIPHLNINTISIAVRFHLYDHGRL